MIFLIIWLAGLAGMFCWFMYPMFISSIRKEFTDEFGGMARVTAMSLIISALWPIWWAIELVIKRKELM